MEKENIKFITEKEKEKEFQELKALKTALIKKNLVTQTEIDKEKK